MDQRVWHVYRLYGETGLLYVGYTRSLTRRLGQHRRTKTWWPEVTEVRSEEFASEDAARQREKEIWAAGRPKHNRLSPFRTNEEIRAQNREYTRRSDRTRSPEYLAQQREYERRPEVRARRRKAKQTPEYRQRKAEYMYEYERRPERRAVHREYSRRYRAQGRTAQPPQTGPGLF